MSRKELSLDGWLLAIVMPTYIEHECLKRTSGGHGTQHKDLTKHSFEQKVDVGNIFISMLIVF